MRLAEIRIISVNPRHRRWMVNDRCSPIPKLVRRCQMNTDRTEPANLHLKDIARGKCHHWAKRTAEHHITGPQWSIALRALLGKPMHRQERICHGGRTDSK